MIKNSSFEECIKKWEPIIKLSGNYSNCSYIQNIIKWGRCWPSQFLSGEKNFHSSKYIEKTWLDEFGNSVHLTNDNIDIIYNSMVAMPQKGTPLYCARAYAQDDLLLKNSAKVFIASSIDPEWKFKLFIRNDGFANARIKYKNEWENISTLVIGIPCFKWLSIGVNQPGSFQMPEFINFLVPCAGLSACLYSISDLDFRGPISSFIEKEKV